MTLRRLLVIVIGSVLAAAFVVVQGTGCLFDCADKYLQSGDFEINPYHDSHQFLDEGILTVDREAGTAKIRYTREGSTYEVSFTLDE